MLHFSFFNEYAHIFNVNKWLTSLFALFMYCSDSFVHQSLFIFFLLLFSFSEPSANSLKYTVEQCSFYFSFWPVFHFTSGSGLLSLVCGICSHCHVSNSMKQHRWLLLHLSFSYCSVDQFRLAAASCCFSWVA